MTFKDFKAEAFEALSAVGNENASAEIDNIIMHFANFTRSQLLLNRSEIIDENILELLKTALERRRRGEPIQYILGEWEFFGLRMFCGKGVLIPREETELLAQIVIDTLPHNGRFLDLCTGSGCISCAVLNNRKDVCGTGVDISDDALVYAEKNVRYHGLSDRFEIVSADLCLYKASACYDVIVSNPPYVKTKDINKLQKELFYEPVTALDGGEDGLFFYDTIVRRYKRFLKENGIIAFEVGYDTGEDVVHIFEKNGMEVKTYCDLSGIMRVVTGKKVF